MAIEVDDGSGPRRQAAKLNVDAMQALSKGNAVVSAQLLEQAVAIDGTNVALWLNLAAARRAAAMFGDALKAVDAALAIDPRGFLALLMKASLLERLGDKRQAATQYGHALAVAPREDLLDPPTRKALAHAQAVSAQNSKELAIFIRERLDQKHSPASSSAASRRVDRFVDLLTGQKRHYPQQPSSFFYPDQPAIEFWERDEFPWLNDLEQSAPAIREELLQVVGDTGSFTPYIEYPDGIPLDQWTELNHSPRWSAFHFYHYGRRYEENCRRCPQTVEVLTSLPQPKVQGRMPAAMFSVLRPKTHIPAHTGVANVRLVVHLPLVVPSGCRFRVGNEMREWKPGQAWVFDDTIEHEAWNDSDQDRVILICDVWNPRLSEGEREAIAELMTALDDFNGVENPPMSI